MYPIEVYDSRIYYKCKKYMLEQLINIKIKINQPYDTLSIEHKIQYHKKYNNQYYFKPENYKVKYFKYDVDKFPFIKLRFM